MPTHLYSSSLFRGKRKTVQTGAWRCQAIVIVISLLGAAVILRLFFLMVLQHEWYVALAKGTHETTAELVPERGQIYIQDSRTKEEYPAAINKDYYLVFIDTRQIKDDETAISVAEQLAEIFSYDEEKKNALLAKANKRTDPYEPVEQKIEESVMQQIKDRKLAGVGFIRQSHRYYPEKTLASQVIGFVGKNETGEGVGRYGVEGYWQQQLSGRGGLVEGIKSALGGWISSAGRSFEPAVDGSDILLTIDRTLQHIACAALRDGAKEYGATSASLIMMDPETGAVRAMCSWPDFDPNEYKKVESIDVYNNSTIYTPYEPGSIFKPIAMAAAINEGLVNPSTPFFDSGHREGVCQKVIQNAGNKSHGNQTMTGVLEYSINTGMVQIAELLGKQRFKKYVELFGFGVKEGVELDTENTGTIASLSLSKKEFDCYTATASFGQGLTVTPLQMAAAYGALANGGKLMKPYIVEEVRHKNGKVDKTHPTELRRVITSRVSSLVSGMLVSVVDSQYGGRARVPGYYVAGKSGTAQIPGPGGYTLEFNHSFVGFAPVENPKYVLLVKYEKPQRVYAESTAAPVFGKVSKFILEYYHVPPNRPVE